MNKRIIAVLSYIDVQGKYVVTIHRQKDIHSSIEVNKYSYSFKEAKNVNNLCERFIKLNIMFQRLLVERKINEYNT